MRITTARPSPSAEATAAPCSVAVISSAVSSKIERLSANITASCVISSSGCLDRPERGRVRRMPVHDRADVGAGEIHLRVQHGLGVHVRLLERRRVVEVERDHVVGLDLVERDAAPLDPDERARLSPRALTWPSVRSA